MALTASDLTKIQDSLAAVIEPRFDATDQRLLRIDSRFAEFRDELDRLSAATNRKFYTVFTDLAMTRDDIGAVRKMIQDHAARLAQLEGSQA